MYFCPLRVQVLLSPSTVQIPENATVGRSVLTVSAQDRDVTQTGHFLFFLGSSPSGKFAINSSSGEITVSAPFDRRIQTDYDVTISVSDNSDPPQSELVRSSRRHHRQQHGPRVCRLLQRQRCRVHLQRQRNVGRGLCLGASPSPGPRLGVVWRRPLQPSERK